MSSLEVRRTINHEGDHSPRTMQTLPCSVRSWEFSVVAGVTRVVGRVRTTILVETILPVLYHHWGARDGNSFSRIAVAHIFLRQVFQLEQSPPHPQLVIYLACVLPHHTKSPKGFHCSLERSTSV